MKAWRIYNQIKQKNEMEKHREGGRNLEGELGACNEKVTGSSPELYSEMHWTKASSKSKKA